jgi:hypothetical protein
MATRRTRQTVRLVVQLPADVHHRLRSHAERAKTTPAAYLQTIAKQHVLHRPPASHRAEPAAAAAAARSWLATLAGATGEAEPMPHDDPLRPLRLALERSLVFEAAGRRALARLREVASEPPHTGPASQAGDTGRGTREHAPSWGVWLDNDTFDEVADLEARFLIERPAPHAGALRSTYGDAIDSFPLAWPASRDLAHRLFLLDHLREIAQQLRATLMTTYRTLAKGLERHLSGAGADLSPQVLLEVTRPQLVRNQRRPLDILRAFVIDVVAAFDEWIEWLELLETVPPQVRGRQKDGRRRKVPEPLRFAAYEVASRLMRIHPRRPRKPTDSDIVVDTHTILTTTGGWDRMSISVGNVRDAIKREHARRQPSERATLA